MSEINYLYEAAPSDNFLQNDLSVPNARPSVFNENKKNKYRNCYKSKWANLKFFLQDKASLEASVNLLKTKTVEQFSTKCKEIYKKKIEIQLSIEKNRKIISQQIKGYDDIWSNTTVSDGISGLPTDAIPDFLFLFRENNHLMLKLLENVDSKQIDILVPFLCHFFYENFYMESTEQEEIIYIIYLLLEKEIDQLLTPSEQTFLDNSFISKFLEEMGSRYEIKNYIDIVLNELISNLEESYSKFYSLEISKISKNLKNDEYFEITPEGELKPKYEFKDHNSLSNYFDSKKYPKLENMITSQNDKTLYKNFNRLVSTNVLSKNINSLIKNMHEDVGKSINEKFLLDNFNREQNDVIKQFLLKQIKKIKKFDNPNLFDSYQLHENLKKKKKIARESLDLFNNGVKIITTFIDNLLSNLENDTIVPYSIKAICKFIYILMQKKFKTITKLELNNLVGRFLFDKLILPILKNPDRSDAGKNKMITLNARKNLINIYLVFKNLVRGELFNVEQNINLVVFNKFIISNYHRVNEIIEKMIDVRIPDKLQKLSDDFYLKDDFILDNSIRSEEEINYEYFKENPNDFMQHKSICFTTNELNIFYNIVEDHKDIFIEPGKPLAKIYETLSNFISMINNNPNHYFVIISDNYNEETEKLLFHKEKTLPLGKAKSQEEIIQNIHYCISYLIGNLEILPHWDWVIENYKTMDTFQYINQYLNSYEGIYNFCPGSVPLNWYSLYIINHLNYIKPEDAVNDYEPLYNNIEKQIRIQLKKLSKLNEFLTVNMTTKFLLIDNKISIFQEELDNVKNTFVNIKALQFMQSKELIVSLASKEELNKLKIPFEGLETYYLKNLILQKETYVQSKNDRNSSKKKDKEDLQPKNISFFCFTIAHFISRYTDYYKSIYEDIASQFLEEKKQNKNTQSQETKTKAKLVLDNYMEYLSIALDESKLFEPSPLKKVSTEDDYQRESIINNNEEENVKNIPSDYKEKVKHSIYNYILKSLCIKLYNEPIIAEDVELHQKCVSLSWLKPENMNINNELYDESIFEQIIGHVKKIDDLRTPEEMLNEIILSLELINSLYIFMLDTENNNDNNSISILTYLIIKTQPKRMIFNLKFIEYFLGENKNINLFNSSVKFIISYNEKKEIKINSESSKRVTSASTAIN